MSRFAVHIIGAGRGGTSLLAALIDSHPDCEICFEQHSMNFLWGGASTEAERIQDPALRAAARVVNFLEACETEAASFPDKLWGHKTTTEHIGALSWPIVSARPPVAKYPWSDDDLTLFVSMLSSIPTIFILRDGRTCVRSKVRRTGQPISRAIGAWKFSVRVLSALRLDHKQLLVIRFEDLITTPRQTLGKVCDFLNIVYTDSMLAGTKSQKMMPEYRSEVFDPTKTEFAEENIEWVHELRSELELTHYPIKWARDTGE